MAFQVLTSLEMAATILTNLLSNWLWSQAGQLDVGANFSFTKIINPNSPMTFYKCELQ